MMHYFMSASSILLIYFTCDPIRVRPITQMTQPSFNADDDMPDEGNRTIRACGTRFIDHKAAVM